MSYLLYIEGHVVTEMGEPCLLRNSGQNLFILKIWKNTAEGGHSSYLRNLSYNKKNCYNTDSSQVASRFSKNIKKSKIQAPHMSKVELPEFSGEPGTHTFSNLPIPQLWDANAWGKKINQ